MALGVLALAAGALIGLLVGAWWRRRATAPAPRATPAEATFRPDGGERVRSQALEAVSEPVLVVGGDGRILECNAAALTLLDRHRPAVSGAEAATIRKLVSPSGIEIAWRELVEARSPWTGEAHVRLPDESRRAMAVRSVPVFTSKGELAGLVEVYRDSGTSTSLTADRFLSALDALDEPGEGDAHEEPAVAAERELRLLALGFAELDKVMRQYEMLLPAMSAEDPLTEAIAGLAAETNELAATADVPRLLREIPRSMTRLRSHLTRLAGSAPRGM